MSYVFRDSVYYDLTKALKLHFVRMHELLEKAGIYPGQHIMLWTLSKHSGLSQKKLASKMFIAPATVNVMIKRMETSGLVRREKDPDDNRVIRVFITEQGEVAAKKAMEIVEQLDGECFANFSVEEKIIMKRLLSQMASNLKETIEGRDVFDQII